MGLTSASSVTDGTLRAAATSDAPAALFRTRLPTSRGSPLRSPRMRSTVRRFASSWRSASSGNLRRRSLRFGSRSASCRTGCWNHQSRRSTALASASRRSASDGQWARSAISKSARQTRAAFFATYAASDAKVKAENGARDTWACSSVAALPAGSSANANSSSLLTGQQTSDSRSRSSSATSSLRGLSCSNSYAEQTTTKMSASVACWRRRSLNSRTDSWRR
mmetsp:Transcript_5431/g.18451  ORF Transcript_5431/g.18451 Transcript_5431/m.18451 type:complete len:222 (+) Transcript_5431:3696-4361(+)